MSSFNFILGDCLIEMNKIENNSIDVIICDLPYGITQNKWDCIIPLDRLWINYERIIKQNGIIILFGQDKFSARLMLSNEKIHRYNLIWEKNTITGFLNVNKMPLRCHEDILIFYKNLPTYNPQKTFGHERKISTKNHRRNSIKTSNYGNYDLTSYDSTERFPRSILKFANDKQTEPLHPTQKPIKLLEYLIITYSNENDLILDNCMGSGSTGIACKNMNRNFIGIEKDENYFNIAKKRIENHIVELKMNL